MIPRLTVLHVNATLSEGGAAGVARTLADGAAEHGVASFFAYGYGPGGRASRLESRYSAVRIATLPTVATNRLLFPLTGRDRSTFSAPGLRRLQDLATDCDVVHLHAIHSYFVDLDSLVSLLVSIGKPVVWTMHDQWLLTGRCAQPAGCTDWQGGCDPCPHKDAYPPARVDRAGTEFLRKRTLLDRLSRSVPVQIVACAQWLQRDLLPAWPSTVCIRNGVDPEFWAAVSGAHRAETPSPTRLMFACRDLRDSQKIDWALLQQIAELPGSRLTVVGDNPPPSLHPEIAQLASIKDRSEWARTMMDHDALVFTSKVDYYPLTVAEALAANIYVMAIESPAAREFTDFANFRIFEDFSTLAGLVSTAATSSRSLTANETMQLSPTRMVSEYVEIYDSLTG